MRRQTEKITKCDELQKGVMESVAQMEDFYRQGRGEVGSSIIVPGELGDAMRLEYIDVGCKSHLSVKDFDYTDVREVGVPDYFNFFSYLDALEDGTELPDLSPLCDPVPPRDTTVGNKGVPWLVQHEQAVLATVSEIAAEESKLAVLLNPSRSAIYNSQGKGIGGFFFDPCFRMDEQGYQWQQDIRMHAGLVRIREISKQGKVFRKGDQTYFQSDLVVYGGSQGHRVAMDLYDNLCYLMPTFNNMVATGELKITDYMEPEVRILHKRVDRDEVSVGVPQDPMLTISETSHFCKSAYNYYWYCGRGVLRKASKRENPSSFPVYSPRSVDYSGKWITREGLRIKMDGNDLVDVEAEAPYWVRRTYLVDFVRQGERVRPLGGDYVFDQDTWFPEKNRMSQDIQVDGFQIEVTESPNCNSTLYVLHFGTVTKLSAEFVGYLNDIKQYKVSAMPPGNYYDSEISLEINKYLSTPKKLPDLRLGRTEKLTQDTQEILNFLKYIDSDEERDPIMVAHNYRVTRKDWEQVGFDVVDNKVQRVIPEDLFHYLSCNTYVLLSLYGTGKESVLEGLKRCLKFDISHESRIGGSFNCLVWNTNNNRMIYSSYSYMCSPIVFRVYDPPDVGNDSLDCF